MLKITVNALVIIHSQILRMQRKGYAFKVFGMTKLKLSVGGGSLGIFA